MLPWASRRYSNPKAGANFNSLEALAIQHANRDIIGAHVGVIDNHIIVGRFDVDKCALLRT